MTIRQLTTQLHNLSLGGYFNSEKFTTSELEAYIKRMFQHGTLKAGNRLVMEIALPDRRWFFTINHYSDSDDGFDYTIPDNEDEEARILALLN